MREVIQPEGIWDPRPRFAQVVRMGNQVYIAGQTSVDAKGNVVGKGDIEAQTPGLPKPPKMLGSSRRGL
jgi:enamine deaminase RidA (YjgF/YER057c/UK114 family)